MKFGPIRYIYRRTGELKTELVPGEKFLKFCYYNPLGKLSLELVAKRKFLTWFYGNQMDKKSSTSRIMPLIESAGIDMSESAKPVEAFNTFNEFFIRELKEGSRPIEPNPLYLASPADGKILAYENLADLKSFFVKGEEFTLSDFLGDSPLGDNPQGAVTLGQKTNNSLGDNPPKNGLGCGESDLLLADKYKDGTFVIVRLAPIDYHRFHFPAAGTISESNLIDGHYYSVSTHAIKTNFRIFCENKREYSILSTENFGDILLCEVAATMVGGIKQSYTPYTFVEKGAEKGYFYFGGSTVVMLFEKGKMKIDKDIIENTLNGLETKVYMGEKIGEKIEKI